MRRTSTARPSTRVVAFFKARLPSDRTEARHESYDAADGWSGPRRCSSGGATAAAVVEDGEPLGGGTMETLIVTLRWVHIVAGILPLALAPAAMLNGEGRGG